MTLYRALQARYNRLLRPHLPDVVGTKSGIEVRDFKLLDLRRAEPDYKHGMVDGVREHAPEARVIEVGVGRGVLTCHAVQAGAEVVHGYEAAGEMQSLARDTLDRNLEEDWTDRVHLQHAVVGAPGNPYGTIAGAETIAPSTLSGDLLVLDVEGAELDILASVGRSKVVVCETHPAHGAPDEAVRAVLERRGYEVTRRAYEPGDPEKSVLVGRDERETV